MTDRCGQTGRLRYCDNMAFMDPNTHTCTLRNVILNSVAHLCHERGPQWSPTRLKQMDNNDIDRGRHYSK